MKPDRIPPPAQESAPPAHEPAWSGTEAPRDLLELLRTVAIIGLFVLAVFYTLYLAQDLFMPLAVAVMLRLMLSPVQRGLVRLRLPEAAAAAVIVLGLMAIAVGAFAVLSVPVSQWAQRLPQLSAQLEYKLSAFEGSVEEFREASKSVQKLASVGDGEGQAEEEPQKVVVEKPGVLPRTLTAIQTLGAQLAITVIVLYFLLAAGRVLLDKTIEAMPTFTDKVRSIAISNAVEREVSVYLFVISLINVGLGVVIGTTMFLIGLPNPVLWGAMATLLNYIPYLGAIVGIAVVGLVGLLTFDTVGEALLAPGIYWAANTIEAQFVTPMLLGRRLTINPLVIFVAVVVWFWMWGVVGAFLAVPFVVTAKIVCDHIEPLHRIGEILGSHNEDGPAVRT